MRHGHNLCFDLGILGLGAILCIVKRIRRLTVSFSERAHLEIRNGGELKRSP
jgi:hypothetical protein